MLQPMTQYFFREGTEKHHVGLIIFSMLVVITQLLSGLQRTIYVTYREWQICKIETLDSFKHTVQRKLSLAMAWSVGTVLKHYPLYIQQQIDWLRSRQQEHTKYFWGHSFIQNVL